jgi:hypothetical protein
MNAIFLDVYVGDGLINPIFMIVRKLNRMEAGQRDVDNASWTI